MVAGSTGTPNERSHHDHSNHCRGSRQERLRGRRRQCLRRRHRAQAPDAPVVRALLEHPRALHGSDGGLRQCSPLGTAPRKIRTCLMERHPELVLPAGSTIGELFIRHGLVKRRRARRKVTHPGSRPLEAEAPNQAGPPTSRGSSRPATASTATRSPWLMPTRGICSPAPLVTR